MIARAFPLQRAAAGRNQRGVEDFKRMAFHVHEQAIRRSAFIH
jgi:hypothetical protein